MLTCQRMVCWHKHIGFTTYHQTTTWDLDVDVPTSDLLAHTHRIYNISPHYNVGFGCRRANEWFVGAYTSDLQHITTLQRGNRMSTCQRMVCWRIHIGIERRSVDNRRGWVICRTADSFKPTSLANVGPRRTHKRILSNFQHNFCRKTVKSLIGSP